jgi:micrococcal nuclease
MSRYRRRSYHLASLIVFIILAIATKYGWLDKSAQVAQSNQAGDYTVIRAVDGDSMDVDMYGHAETVRFIVIDTPETHKPNTPVQCYGPEAASYTKSQVEGKQVRLQADSLDTNRDRYGRLLRYVYLPDDSLLQDQLVSQGYAFAYTQFPFEKKAAIVAEEQAAKHAGKGLWSACQVIVESNGREQTNAQ